MSQQDQKIQLYYWKAPGKAQFIRFLLEYLELPYEEIFYTPADAQEKWFKGDKINLGFDFPNLPSIIDGDIKLSENLALTSYLPVRAQKEELNGKGLDRFKVDEIKNVCIEFQPFCFLASIEKDQEVIDKYWKEKIYPKMVYLNKYYKDREWGVGYLTVADFYYYCVIQHSRVAYNQLWEKEFRDDQVKFLQRFEAIPQIDQYMKSDKYMPYHKFEN